MNPRYGKTSLDIAMTLTEFCEMIRTNIDLFETDYVKKRGEHPNPNESYPLSITPEMWFMQLDMWFRMLEALGGLKEPEPIYTENEVDEDGTIEFTLENFDEPEQG